MLTYTQFLTESSAVHFFRASEIAAASHVSYKSREKLIEMAIADFLGLADTGVSADKTARVNVILNAHQTFDTIPRLQFELKEGRAVVTGHEGRHRARAVAERGCRTMPVILQGDIRWSEQDDPKNFSYVQSWPDRLYGQGGKSFSVPFPVSREAAAKPYTS